VKRVLVLSLATGCLGCTPNAQTLAAALRVATAAGKCLQGILTAERATCDASADREACLAQVDRRFVALLNDMQTVKEASCESDPAESEIVFAGVCEP
jgi:hypothetical protein